MGRTWHKLSGGVRREVCGASHSPVYSTFGDRAMPKPLLLGSVDTSDLISATGWLAAAWMLAAGCWLLLPQGVGLVVRGWACSVAPRRVEVASHLVVATLFASSVSQ